MLAFCVQRVHRYWNSDVKAPTPVCVFSVWGVRTCWHCHFDSSWRTGFKTRQDCAKREEGRKEGVTKQMNTFLLIYPMKGFQLFCVSCLMSLCSTQSDVHVFVWRAAWSGSLVVWWWRTPGPAHIRPLPVPMWRRWIWCGRDQSPPPACSEDWWQMWANLLFLLRLRASHQSGLLHASKHQKKKKKKKTSGWINVLWFDYSGLNSSLHVFSLCLPPLVSLPGRIPACW